MLTFGKLRNLGPLILALAGLVLVAALFNVILSVVLAPLLNKIRPVLASKLRERILLAVLCGLVVLCSFVLPAFLGVAVLSILMARQAAKEWRYQSEWA